MVENPAFPGFLHGQEVLITGVLLLILGGVFLLGFSEAISVAIPLVAVFLALNAAIVMVGTGEMLATPDALSAWTDRLTQNNGGFFGIVGPAVLAFPLLVPGLSGFETGVSMMPLVKADGSTPERRMASKVRNSGRRGERARARLPRAPPAGQRVRHGL
jgi:hypothetical protein